MPLIAKDSHVLLSHVSREREYKIQRFFTTTEALDVPSSLNRRNAGVTKVHHTIGLHVYTIHTSMIFIAAEKAQGLDGLFQSAHFLVFYAVLLLFCPQLMNVMSRFFYFHFLFFCW